MSEPTNQPLFDLSGRVAIVTGTSRGLGQQFARALATAGADLVLTSRKRDSLVPFEEEIKALGRRTSCRSNSMFAISKASNEWRLPPKRPSAMLDILVNNAGCNVRKPALDVTWDDWNLILDTNLRGSFFVAQAVARRMISRALRTHHQHRLGHERRWLCRTRALWSEPRRHPATHDESGRRLGPHGITVNCLAPGWFRTDQNKILYEDKEWVEYLSERIPVKRPGELRDLDAAVVFLAAESSRYVTGQTSAGRWRNLDRRDARSSKGSLMCYLLGPTAGASLRTKRNCRSSRRWRST